MSDDFPAFGRPTTATSIAGSASLSLGRGQPVNDDVEEIAAPLPHGGAHTVRVAEPELVEIVLGGAALEVVELVYRHDYGAFGVPETIGDRAVHRVDPFGPVHNEDHDIGLGKGKLHLLANGAVHRVVGVGYQPAGIHQPEMTPAPLGVAEVPVPRGAGAVGHDGRPASQDPVEQGGLPRVGPADDGHGRFTHAAAGVCRASAKSFEVRTSNDNPRARESRLMLSMNNPSSLRDSPGISARSRPG